MSFRRSLLLAWIAAALTALAPVFAYAHIHVGAHGEIVESCATGDEPAPIAAHEHHAVHGHDAAHEHQGVDAHDAAPGSGEAPQAPGSHSAKGGTPHCIYCPGFAAGATLAPHALDVPGPAPAAIASVCLAPAVPDGRPSVRIAQQRGPPSAP